MKPTLYINIVSAETQTDPRIDIFVLTATSTARDGSWDETISNEFELKSVLLGVKIACKMVGLEYVVLKDGEELI